jgi:SAM-dependent MidA family methyltransferase
VSDGTASLRAKLEDHIRRHGPMGVHDYMARCLSDPELGYYRRKPALGAGGDFITAPEISQMFGELLGLWAIVVWQSMGGPRSLRLIELGPGRGTMIADALRAARVRQDFMSALTIDLVEASEALRTEQQRRLVPLGLSVCWHEDVSEVPADRPAVLFANEFVDALPVFQFVRRGEAWRERAVTLTAAGALAFSDSEPTPSASKVAALLAPLQTAPDGAIAEVRDNAPLAAEIARLAGQPFAGLFIDYGHEGPVIGDTLQAVSRHAYADPLAAPGEADITAHVDFALLAVALRKAGLEVEPLLTQGEFLTRLGIIERARRLAAQNPRTANEIETAVSRLVSPAAMGQRFKVLAVRGMDVPRLPAFRSPIDYARP